MTFQYLKEYLLRLSTKALQARRTSSLIDLTVFLSLLWLMLIWPHNFNWMGYQNNLNGSDYLQHLSGWYAFVNEPWHFPLLHTTLLDYPKGTSISLTDSLPLFAVIFKLCRSILPPGYNYFSLLFIFCYLAQAFSAMTLAISLKQNNNLAVATFVLFALSAPIVNTRLGGEDALAFQCFILLGLSLYFFTYFNHLSWQRLQIYFGLLIGVSLLIHPYLTAMTYPLYLASLYQTNRQIIQSKKGVFSLCLLHGFIGLEIFVFGLGTGTQATLGFGVFNMNFFAPFYGGLLHHDHSIIGNPLQAEGFAYLGLGLMLMLTFAIYLASKFLQKLYQNHWLLFWLGVGFVVYASYGLIYWGTIPLVISPMPHFFLTDDFRTNGRFFWTPWYMLMTFALTTVLHSKQSPSRKLLIMIILTLIQLIDTAGYTVQAKTNLKTAMQKQFLPQETVIEHLISQSKIVIYTPRANCPHSPASFPLMVSSQFLAALNHTPINTAYTAHTVISKSCPANFVPQLYPQLWISERHSTSQEIQQALKTQPQACQIIENGYYCLIHSPLQSPS